MQIHHIAYQESSLYLFFILFLFQIVFYVGFCFGMVMWLFSLLSDYQPDKQ